MANGLTHDMEFERELDETLSEGGTDALLKLVARRVNDMSKNCPVQEKRIKALENQNKKLFSLVGTGSAIIGGIVVAMIDYIRR